MLDPRPLCEPSAPDEPLLYARKVKLASISGERQPPPGQKRISDDATFAGTDNAVPVPRLAQIITEVRGIVRASGRAR